MIRIWMMQGRTGDDMVNEEEEWRRSGRICENGGDWEKMKEIRVKRV